MLPVRHDLHVHTRWSDGYRSVEEQAFLAEAQGLEAIAITDHFFAGQKLASDDGFDRYLAEIEAARAGRVGLRVLKGAEATVLDPGGTLSIDAGRAGRLEWVLCDLCGLSEGTLRNTPSSKREYAANVLKAYHAVCRAPHVHAIAHPFNTGNSVPALLPADFPEPPLRELACAMEESGKVFDVMNLMALWYRNTGAGAREITQQYAWLVGIFASCGVRFQVSSDDHRSGLGSTGWSQRILEMAKVPEDLVVKAGEIALLPARGS